MHNNPSFNITPIINQIARSEGATIALAKSLLDEDSFEQFLVEYEIQSRYSMMDFIEQFPNIIEDKEDLRDSLNASIESLKKKRK